MVKPFATFTMEQYTFRHRCHRWMRISSRVHVGPRQLARTGYHKAHICPRKSLSLIKPEWFIRVYAWKEICGSTTSGNLSANTFTKDLHTVRGVPFSLKFLIDGTDDGRSLSDPPKGQLRVTLSPKATPAMMRMSLPEGLVRRYKKSS